MGENLNPAENYEIKLHVNFPLLGVSKGVVYTIICFAWQYRVL